MAARPDATVDEISAPARADRAARRRAALQAARARPSASRRFSVKVPAFVQPLRHRRFRRVWIGQAVSAIGDGITFVALTGAVLAYHTSEELGLVLGAQSLSLVAVALFGG